MKIYKNISLSEVETIIENNGGELEDCLEGVLLDDLLMYGNNGYIAMFETFVNCWTSCYTVYESENENDSDYIYSLWSKRQDEREKQAQEIEDTYKRLKGDK